MNDREYALAKELAALWPEDCIDTRLSEKIRRLYALPADGVASDRLQDYLDAAEKRWPELHLGMLGLTPESSRWWSVHLPSHVALGTGETICERILDALLQAAKGEA